MQETLAKLLSEALDIAPDYKTCDEVIKAYFGNDSTLAFTLTLRNELKRHSLLCLGNGFSIDFKKGTLRKRSQGGSSSVIAIAVECSELIKNFYQRCLKKGSSNMNTDLLESIKSERHDVVHITEPQEPSSITIRSFNDTTLYSLMMAVLKNTAHSEDPLDAVLLDDLIELEASRVMVTTNDGYLEYLDVQYDDWVLIFSNEKPSDRNKGKSSLTIRDRQIGNSINLEAKSLDNLLSGLNSWLAAV